MSVETITNVSISYPADTMTIDDSFLSDMNKSVVNGQVTFHYEREGFRLEEELADLAKFFGSSLDEVSGLYLSIGHSDYEDEEWHCLIDIDDGEVRCSQTVTEWKDCTIENLAVPVSLEPKGEWKVAEAER